MKIPILIALGALYLTASVANAQPANDNNGGVQLKDIPDNVPLLRSNPYLDLGQKQTAGTHLRVAPGARGQIMQVEIVRQDSGEALRQLAAVLGVSIVIDPAIQFLPAKTRSLYFNYVGDDVFESISNALVRNEAAEKWKSSAGTYFFVAKPTPTLDELEQQLDKYRLESEKRRENADPFVFGTPKQVEPQPHWQKREFNGREFYYVPGPNP